jgi:phosphohistidine phosphatase
MKNIYLIRHAKSSWDNPALKDFDRPLNSRGANDAKAMADHIKQLGVHPDLMVSSPANRAITTAREIASRTGYDPARIVQDEKLYLADVSEIYEVVWALDEEYDTVFLFGHNPGFTDFANTLSSTKVDNLPTCGIFAVEFEVDNWTEIQGNGGVFKLFDYPKKVHQ